MGAVRRLLLGLGMQSVAGLAVWIVVAVAAITVEAGALDLVTVLLLFGQLVIVPLGLLLIDTGPGLDGALVRGGRFLFRAGGVAALASLAVPRGEVSAAIAALYLLPALSVAAGGALRFADGPAGVAAWRPERVASFASGIFLAIGAVLFVLHRQDVAWPGFPELAVQLASVHLHFAGFGLLLMAGQLARRRRRIGAAVVWLLVAGTVMLPLGAPSALLLVAGWAALTAGTFSVLGDASLPGAARRLLFVSTAVAVFAAGVVTAALSGLADLDASSMARLHGAFAAVGVVFCGLLGWRLAEPSSRSRRCQRTSIAA